MEGYLLREEQILVLSEHSDDLDSAGRSITAEIPSASITKVESLSDYRKAIDQTNFDIVVLNHSIVDEAGANIIHELRVKDYDPWILVVSAAEDPNQVAEAFNSGCHHCIVKDDQWVEKIGPAVRGLLRFQRLDDMNVTLIAKLTEANALLEEENSRLDEFAKTVAHDIRGPLGGICMRLEYMRDVYKDDLDERFSTLLETSYCSSRRLIEVVQAMYEFAKLGAKSTRIENIDLAAFIEEVLSDLSLDDHINLEVGIGEIPPIWGDRMLLRKVFINLIGNAVKYNDKDTIVVNIGVNGVVHRSLSDFCEIYIQDNGPGIPEDEVDDVFLMFRRGVDTKETTEGTGIGLSVVKRVIELHYGRVRVESEPGDGAKFIISLPMDKISLEA